MKIFKFCINKDCTTACEAETENDAWEWLSQTKRLSIPKLKKLYTIKLK
jgi:hypothetical protein